MDFERGRDCGGIMPKLKPRKNVKPKHPDVQRETMNDIRELSESPTAIHNEIRYLEPNRDRAVGDADRTGRHFDEVEQGEGTEGSKEQGEGD
jgi:hypothetical protein